MRRLYVRYGLLGVVALLLLLLFRKKSSNYSELNQGTQPSSPSMAATEHENARRQSQIRQVCSRRHLLTDEPPAPQYSVFYFVKNHRIAYCPIYKSASTSWIYNLCLLAGVPESELIDSREQLSVIARRVLPEMDYPEAEELLRNYRKLIIVRHPFERLLSAYRDKLENSLVGREHGTLHFYRKYGAIIVRKFRNDSIPRPRADQVIQIRGNPAPAGIEPTWREFIEYLIHTDLASYADDHWIPYNLFCTPCHVDYDIVAKVETLDRDQAYIIDRLGLTGKIKPIHRHSTANSTLAAQVYFSQLSREQVHQLYLKYQLDFELFDYSPRDYYDYATSAAR